jgi:hypothetical protein
MAESSEPGLLYAALSRVKGEGGESKNGRINVWCVSQIPNLPERICLWRVVGDVFIADNQLIIIDIFPADRVCRTVRQPN